MRDKRCNRKIVKERLDYQIKGVDSCFKRIEEFKKYIEDKLYKDGLDKENKIDLIDSNYSGIIKRELEIINYKYTLGEDLLELHKEYLVLLDQIDKIKSLGGYFFANIVSLGILFEEGIEKFEKLIIIMDESRHHDLLSDYFINGCGLKRKYYSEVFELDRFKFSKELIELAQKDREQASKKLVHHFKTYWNDPVKSDSYDGYWLWEYAAISKMFKLDDSELKDNPHYPYELAHYKNEMEFMPEKMLDFPKETYKKGIPEYPRLEKLIPAKFHEMTNNFLNDYKKLDYDEFCEKYELDWLEPDEYVGQEEDLETFGVNFILFLSDIGYIFQFDKLDDLEEVDFYKKFWGRKKVRPIHFQLNSDCYYIAYVPKSVKLKSIFGVKIEEVKDLKELDQYQEYLGQFDNE